MKLSNTMIMNSSVMPSKKAFTLAEVLITLSILGVVAALTIPSLVNRQSQMAAIVKMKKAVSQFEQVAEVYMAENEATDISGMVSKTTGKCDNLSGYFKMVTKSDNDCVFTTADGVEWRFASDGSAAIAYDSATSPTYGVIMWVNSDGQANVGTAPTSFATLLNTTATDAPTFYTATEMLKINKTNDTATTTTPSFS